MTPKEYLQQYREAVRRKDAIITHIAELRATCEQLRTEDGRRVSLEKAVAALVDAQERTASEVARLAKLEAEITATIDNVQDPYRTLLYERYINGKTWEQIAVDMHYSYRGVTKMHGRALQALKECIEVPTQPVL